MVHPRTETEKKQAKMFCFLSSHFLKHLKFSKKTENYFPITEQQWKRRESVGIIWQN